jgi:hypothetical protein
MIEDPKDDLGVHPEYVSGAESLSPCLRPKAE